MDPFPSEKPNPNLYKKYSPSLEFVDTGHPTRNKVISKLAVALESKDKDGPTSAAMKLATQIEAQMFRKYQIPKGDYLHKFRDIFFNFKDKKNLELNRFVLNGTIHPEELIQLSTNQLASKDLRASRQSRDATITKDIRSDLKKSNQIKTDVFKCVNCGKRNTEYYQLQTRGADEPMTNFIHCLECDKRWRS